MNIEEAHELIKTWSIARNLPTGDPTGQVMKLGEEYGELCGAVIRGNTSEIIDAIGDMFVVQTVLCQQLGLDFAACIEDAYNEIKDRKGRLVNGVFVKEADLQGG